MTNPVTEQSANTNFCCFSAISVRGEKGFALEQGIVENLRAL